MQLQVLYVTHWGGRKHRYDARWWFRASRFLQGLFNLHWIEENLDVKNCNSFILPLISALCVTVTGKNKRNKTEAEAQITASNTPLQQRWNRKAACCLYKHDIGNKAATLRSRNRPWEFARYAQGNKSVSLDSWLTDSCFRLRFKFAPGEIQLTTRIWAIRCI